MKSILKQSGPIPFVEFMQHALYHPQFGYYTSSLPKFGHEGDFITAPELTNLFGYTLANQCLELVKTMPDFSILEFGAGSGKLCIDILTHLEKHRRLPETYLILEVSGALQARQQRAIQQAIPHLAKRVKWLTSWPKKPFKGVILANEILDAMPIHRFVKHDGTIYEYFVGLDDQENIKEDLLTCKDERLLAYITQALPDLPNHYSSEVNLFIDSWVQQCFDHLIEGAAILIDYGFPRHEYYHPDRHQGTLMCHYQHQAHTNPYLHIGEQDITAHVDFTHVAEAAHQAGFDVAGYTNQAAFLLANGLLNLVSDNAISIEKINQQQAIKVLTHPSEMGELFKVIALTKHLELPLASFQLHDKRANL